MSRRRSPHGHLLFDRERTRHRNQSEPAGFRGILAVMTRLYPRLPVELQPTYASLREWPLLRDHVNGKLGGLPRTQ